MTSDPFQLTVCIPTYNRAAKLARLLGLLRDQILAGGLERRVMILVSDNASSDGTGEALASFDARGIRLEAIRQPRNLGFDGNIWELYRRATTPYLWYFSDDDLPYQGCVATVLSRIQASGPALLLFSFVQPPGTTQRPLASPDAVTTVTDPRQQAEIATAYPKLSIYAMRRVAPTPSLTERLEGLDGSAYTFVTLALEALAAGGHLEVLSAALAGCDEEFEHIRFPALTWSQYTRVFQHPFIARWAPHLVESSRRQSYLSLVSFLWAWRRGTLQVQEDLQADYWKALRSLPLRWRWLLSARRSLVQAVLLKVAPRLGPRAAGYLGRSTRRSNPIATHRSDQ
ncbi:MAG: glycosyltransferase [Anaeromyxobacter sp.]|nr:glycosyltransferase [Anaeromyxobacter sp.]